MLEDITPAAGQAGLPPFPTWPPPTGGAPVSVPELGPIISPYPYPPTTQTAHINTAQTPPLPLANGYPHIMPPLNGQNQQQQLPAWPWPAKMTTLPDKAPPSLSVIP